MKEWITGNGHGVNFHNHNKILIKCCVHFNVECWKRKCIRLYSLEMKIKVLKEDAIALLDLLEKMKQNH